MSTSQEQVTRMLALVPYLRGNEGVPVAQVAETFGVPRRQIVKDLNVLWFCGLPGAVTGEMIDVDMEALRGQGVVYVDNAEFLARPVRLTAREAVALVVALRTLRESARSDERDVIERALAKLESAAGDAAAASAAVEVVLDEHVDATLRDQLASAVRDRRRVHLTYLVPWRDERTERDVDPLRVLTAEGRTYLEGWCHRAEDLRLFRLDRVVGLDVLDVPADEHPDVPGRDLSQGVYRPHGEGPYAVLDLSPNAHWICEYYPVEDRQDRPDGVVRVTLRGDEEWLRRFVLRQTGTVRVVEPAALADDVRSRARLALGAYSEDEATGAPTVGRTREEESP
ncbi:MAG: YafY family protein [Nocardioidaceae bacterium]|nr:YafY family protein [Nocardioidaceae bacterium]